MSMNGLFESHAAVTSMEDWKKRFSLYEDDIRNNYLFVQVCFLCPESKCCEEAWKGCVFLGFWNGDDE